LNKHKGRSNRVCKEGCWRHSNRLSWSIKRVI